MGTAPKRPRPKTKDDAGERAGDQAPAKIQPARKKVGEEAGNLRERARWFRKRASGER